MEELLFSALKSYASLWSVHNKKFFMQYLLMERSARIQSLPKLMISIARNTKNLQGSNVTTVNVDQIPGLNTLGISLVRIDYPPYGQNPPHTHPRATEILVVLEGTLYVGFVTSNTENYLFTKVLNKGDVFVFPVGLIHF